MGATDLATSRAQWPTLLFVSSHGSRPEARPGRPETTAFAWIRTCLDQKALAGTILYSGIGFNWSRVALDMTTLLPVTRISFGATFTNLLLMPRKPPTDSPTLEISL
jgi:hypothetical protein